MRRYIVPFFLLILFFVFPFQVFIIGQEIGIGIQGAVYRYQVTGYGNSLIPVSQEVMYVINGVYSGKTALSTILWALGTVLLTITTWFGLVHADSNRPDYYRQVSLGITGSCICYLSSCIAQYGILLHGPAGFSIPLGIAVILIWLAFIHFFEGIYKKNPGRID